MEGCIFKVKVMFYQVATSSIVNGSFVMRGQLDVWKYLHHVSLLSDYIIDYIFHKFTIFIHIKP